jgi:hypothetical protein
LVTTHVSHASPAVAHCVLQLVWMHVPAAAIALLAFGHDATQHFCQHSLKLGSPSGPVPLMGGQALRQVSVSVHEVVPVP